MESGGSQEEVRGESGGIQCPGPQSEWIVISAASQVSSALPTKGVIGVCRVEGVEGVCVCVCVSACL